MPKPISTSYQNNSPLPIDSRQAKANGDPWDSVAQALLNYPVAYRKPGKHVNILINGKLVDHWFDESNQLVPVPIGDGGLIPGNKQDVTVIDPNTIKINDKVITKDKITFLVSDNNVMNLTYKPVMFHIYDYNFPSVAVEITNNVFFSVEGMVDGNQITVDFIRKGTGRESITLEGLSKGIELPYGKDVIIRVVGIYNNNVVNWTNK